MLSPKQSLQQMFTLTISLSEDTLNEIKMETLNVSLEFERTLGASQWQQTFTISSSLCRKTGSKQRLERQVYGVKSMETHLSVTLESAILCLSLSLLLQMILTLSLLAQELNFILGLVQIQISQE